MHCWQNRLEVRVDDEGRLVLAVVVLELQLRLLPLRHHGARLGDLAAARAQVLRELGFLTEAVEAVAAVVDSKKAMNQIFTSHGVDKMDVFFTDEEIQQKEQQAQMMQMASQLGPNAVTQLGGVARDQAERQGGVTPPAAAPPPEEEAA